MPRYIVAFETTKGEFKYQVPIPSQVPLVSIMSDLLAELEEKHYRLLGSSRSSVEVVWNGRSLDQNRPLPEQGVQPLDTLAVRAADRLAMPASHVKPVAVQVEATLSSVKILYVIAAILPVFTFIYVALQSANSWAVPLVSVAGCGVLWGLWYLAAEVPGKSIEFLPCVTCIAASLGALFLAKPTDVSTIGPVLAIVPIVLLGGAGALRIKLQNRLVCEVGSERFTGYQFTCPRCGLTCCLQHWHTARVRCIRCDEDDKPWLLLLPDEWWQERLGPSIGDGGCVRCHSTPKARDVFRERRDLRECGRCGTLQCKWCWDLTNGECMECGWSMPGLPAALAGVAGRNDAGRKVRR